MPRRLTNMRRIVFVSLLLLALTASGAGSFSYLYSRDGNSIISGNIDVDRLLQINKRFPAPFLWARIDGKQYLIRDKTTLARVTAAFRDVDALHVEHERIERRMRPVEQREEELEDEMDGLSDALSDRDDLSRAERARMERRLDELTALIEPVQRQLRDLEREEEKLDQREEKLTAIAEREVQELVEDAIRRGLASRVN
jgi:DNA repair exonuclease SbcCD ATPase subunit